MNATSTTKRKKRIRFGHARYLPITDKYGWREMDLDMPELAESVEILLTAAYRESQGEEAPSGGIWRLGRRMVVLTGGLEVVQIPPKATDGTLVGLVTNIDNPYRRVRDLKYDAMRCVVTNVLGKMPWEIVPVHQVTHRMVKDFWKAIQRANLTGEELQAVLCKYGFFGWPLTYESIARDMKCSRELVRAREVKAIHKLRVTSGVFLAELWMRKDKTP